MKKKDIVYYARIQPALGVYEIPELIVRTVENGWFTGMDKRDKRVYLFADKDINKTIFADRKEALKIVKEAEKYKRKLIFTTDKTEIQWNYYLE